MKKIFVFSLLPMVAAMTLSCKDEKLMESTSRLRFSPPEVVMKSQKADTVLVSSNYKAVLGYAHSHVDDPIVMRFYPNATRDTIYGGWLKVVMHDYEIKLMTTEDNTTGNKRMYTVYINIGNSGLLYVWQSAQ